MHAATHKFHLCVPGIRRKENDVPEEEENFDEAITAVNKALVPTKVLYYTYIPSKGPAIPGLSSSIYEFVKVVVDGLLGLGVRYF